ncbi:undecaprenyl-phosphate glucose phosphotransferase [Maridesulfovibrio zosterae]|uniref:undecaprenyl-phosphate glucose phosphotransferase n=1 Tax=Maridesulfovibrio zosterae TaxID=82171 RepID=UPI0003F59F6F|nr:undecaprenyl-phosphate glucose phosphotransferase [Maridesulfovibrio zosterae]
MGYKFRFQAKTLSSLHRVIDALFGAVGLLIFYSLFSPGSFVSRTPQISMLVITSVLLTLVCFHLAGVYKEWSGSDIISECNRVIVSVLCVFGGMLILGYIFKVSSIYSRRVILLWVFVWPALLCLERVFIRKFFFNWIFETSMNKKAVIAGTGSLGATLFDWIRENPWAGVNVEGFFDREDNACNGSTPCIGQIERLPQYVKENDIQLVYLALPMREESLLNQLLHELEDSTAQIYFFPDMTLFKKLMGGNVAQVAGQAAIALRSSPFEGMNGFIKRLEDISISLLILFFISPVMFIIALGIKMTSKGPVLFKQWRYGLGGHPFQIYKFRTMKVLEDGYDFVPATTDDPRITRFGLFLRQNSLDELPQFLNVLLGSMSIVGPRPHAVKMNEEYRKHISGYMLRHISKPGITGLAQINGYKGEIHSNEDMEKRISYDIEYLQRWSVFLDLEIIFKTIFKLAWRQ